MPSLRDTVTSLMRGRKQFVPPRPQRMPGTPASRAFEDLPEVTGFGTNPGNLQMFKYVPDNLADDRPLVVVLHGCTQSAAGYARASGWVDLAADLGFAVLAPQQQQSNNANKCFNWFEKTQTTRDQGEAFSIWEMVERMIVGHRLDRKRIYVTGLSAGGAMACVMLATYPDVFAGGAIIAGLPYRCADGVQQALTAMAHPRPPSMRSPGDMVRAASLHRGPWPRVSIWHGKEDKIVIPANAAAIAEQWCDVHGLAENAFVQDTLDGQAHRTWSDAWGAVAVETIIVDGLAHGTPIDAAGATGEPTGSPAPFVLDVGISSTRRIAARWGLGERGETGAARPVPAPAEKTKKANKMEPSDGGILAPAARTAMTALRKVLPGGLLPKPETTEPREWETVSDGPDAAPTFFGYASSGINCVGGLHRKSMSRMFRVEAGQRLVYERRLHLHAGVNIMTSAAFRVTVDGETVDQEAVVFTNRMEHNWTAREIDLSRYAGRDVDACFEVSADCNVCIEVFAKAWVRSIRLDPRQVADLEAYSAAQ